MKEKARLYEYNKPINDLINDMTEEECFRIKRVLEGNKNTLFYYSTYDNRTFTFACFSYNLLFCLNTVDLVSFFFNAYEYNSIVSLA